MQLLLIIIHNIYQLDLLKPRSFFFAVFLQKIRNVEQLVDGNNTSSIFTFFESTSDWLFPVEFILGFLGELVFILIITYLRKIQV